MRRSDLQPVDLRCERQELSAELRGGEVEVRREADRGRRDATVRDHLAAALLGVGTGHEHALEGRDLLEHRLPGAANLGRVHAGVRAEHDRAALAAAEAAEVCVERIKAAPALGVGELERRIEGGTDREDGAEHEHHDRDPDTHDPVRVTEAPHSESCDDDRILALTPSAEAAAEQLVGQRGRSLSQADAQRRPWAAGSK
jgi:hypothetical protein